MGVQGGHQAGFFVQAADQWHQAAGQAGSQVLAVGLAAQDMVGQRQAAGIAVAARPQQAGGPDFNQRAVEQP